MENDKYCLNCEYTTDSERAVHCELCGLKLFLFSERYCNSGCENNLYPDDKFCSKCGQHLLPITNKRICSVTDCENILPENRWIQEYLNNSVDKKLISDIQDRFFRSALCIKHLMGSNSHFECEFEICGEIKFAGDLCLIHYNDLFSIDEKARIKKCRRPSCARGSYFTPYKETSYYINEQKPRLHCNDCYWDEFHRFAEEYNNAYLELKALYEKNNKDLTCIRINGYSMSHSLHDDMLFGPNISRTLSFMKEEIYKLNGQSPPYERCVRCGKENIPTVAEYCMVCLRSTKEYADHWFEEIEERKSSRHPPALGSCGTSYMEEKERWYWAGRCGLCFNSHCSFNIDENIFTPECSNCKILINQNDPDDYYDLSTRSNCPKCKKSIAGNI